MKIELASLGYGGDGYSCDTPMCHIVSDPLGTMNIINVSTRGGYGELL